MSKEEFRKIVPEGYEDREGKIIRETVDRISDREHIDEAKKTCAYCGSPNALLNEHSTRYDDFIFCNMECLGHWLYNNKKSKEGENIEV